MTRALLQWSDIRPTRLRARGASGFEYQIEQTTGGRWVLWLWKHDAAGAKITRASDGWLADMKALAAAHEADALGPAPEPQRINWVKAAPSHYRDRALNGRAYRILKIGDTWQLEALAHVTDTSGTPLDEGSLAAMKAAAARDATSAAAKQTEDA